MVVQAKRREVDTVGSIYQPADITGAQFSGAFGIALRLLKGGNQFLDYTTENLRDPEILGLAKKVRFVINEELEKLPAGSAPARVTIRLTDGTHHTAQVDYAKGTVQNPMTSEELQAKFRGLASMVLPADRVEKIVQTAGELEELDNIHELGTLLVADKKG